MPGAPLLDSDTLSEIIKGRDPRVQSHAAEYLAEYGRFRFSILTRYEILRGLKAKGATRQIEIFDQQCKKSDIVPLTDEIVASAADIYGVLYRRGELISDADILIAATALVDAIVLITENRAHFARIPNLQVESWRTVSAE